MNPVFLLLKDHRVIIDDDIEKYYNEIEFVIYQSDPEVNTYVILTPERYMYKMKRAKITIESVVTNYTIDYVLHHVPIGKVVKEVNSYLEMIQYLHSLYRLKYYNSLIRQTDYENIPPYEIVEFCYFHIKVYDHDDKILYKKKISLVESIKKGNIYLNEFFEPDRIIENIRDIYFPELSIFKEYLSIDPVKLKWDFGKEDYKYNICALWHDETNTISFFSYEDMIYLNRLSSIFAMGFVFDMYNNDHMNVKKLNDLEGLMDELNVEYPAYTDIRYYDCWYFEVSLIVEYIVYLPYLNMVILTNTEIVDNQKITDTHEVLINICIGINGREYTIRYTRDHPFVISDLIEVCKKY